jgi:nucleotide-binding universal stress UspA family protein
MRSSFKKIGLAVAFSPTLEAMLGETFRLVDLLQADLVLFHAGQHTPELEERLRTTLRSFTAQPENIVVRWIPGDPATVILQACNQEKIDLLVTGALKKENLVQHYVGTIARKILRKARCSVLTIVNPVLPTRTYRNVVVNAEDSSYITEAISVGCYLAAREHGSWVHVVRELKLYGLTMASSDQYTETEYEDRRQELVRQEVSKVEEILQRVPHEGLKINIKMVSGKPGYELAKFAERKQADLLVVGAPNRRSWFFDRLFPHDMEYVFADLPCNLLIVRPNRKENTNG